MKHAGSQHRNKLQFYVIQNEHFFCKVTHNVYLQSITRMGECHVNKKISWETLFNKKYYEQDVKVHTSTLK